MTALTVTVNLKKGTTGLLNRIGYWKREIKLRVGETERHRNLEKGVHFFFIRTSLFGQAFNVLEF